MKLSSWPLIVAIIIQGVAPCRAADENKLNWAKVSDKAASDEPFSTQIMLDFPISPTFTVTHEGIDGRERVIIRFANMKRSSFDDAKLDTILKDLKAKKILTHLNLDEQAHANGVDTLLALDFAPITNTAKTRNHATPEKNQFIVLVGALENTHRVIIDIYKKEQLDEMQHHTATYLYASNDLQQSDSVMPGVQGSGKKKSGRIVIDAGHGGSDHGAAASLDNKEIFEKNIALDISRHSHALLKKDGFKVFLTRNSDKNISLFERSAYAHKCKADLFVSIHVNAAGNAKSDAAGVETFYFDGQKLLQHNKTRCLFINTPQDKQAAKRLIKHYQHKASKARTLANKIQGSIMNMLHEQNIHTNDRGVKMGECRLFLLNGVPTVLVEVGFIKSELPRLANKSHRKDLAMAIVNGIRTYLQAQQH